MADPLAVECPDCNVPARTPCAGHLGTHAGRQHLADLRALEQGTCALCGQWMVRGSVDGQPVDAWHPIAGHAAACPPMPDPLADWNGYATMINLGLSAGHPGVEHFQPTPDTPQALTGVPQPPAAQDDGPALLDSGPNLLAAFSDAVERARAERQQHPTPEDPPEDDLPGMWSHSDTTGGGETVRGPDWTPPTCPECVSGKHPNCDGTAWDTASDSPAPCACAKAGHA